MASTLSIQNIQSLAKMLTAGNFFQRVKVLLQYLYYHGLQAVSPRLSLERPKIRAEPGGVTPAADRTASIEFYLEGDANARSEFEQADPKSRALVSHVANKFKTSRCFICDGALMPVVQVVDYDDADDFIEMSWCASCDHLQYSVMPPKEWITRWYASSWDVGGSIATKLATRKPSHRCYRRLAPLMKSGKLKILDLGAGYGEKVLPFKEAGHTIFCTEASERRVDYLREHVTENVYFGTLDDPDVRRALRENGPFDVILTYHVVEHIYNPREELQILRELAAEDGIFYIAIPELYKEGIVNNIYTLEHIASFSRLSAETLMKQVGFRPVVSANDPFQYYSNYCQYLIGRKAKDPGELKLEKNNDPGKMVRYLTDTLQLDRIASLPGSSFSLTYNPHAPLTYRVSDATKMKCRDPSQHLPIRIYHRGLPLFWNYS